MLVINKENLLKAGYRTYANIYKDRENGYIESFEKRIDDKTGKKYFIHLNCWNFKKFNFNEKEPRFDSEVQFHTVNDETFNVNYFVYYNKTTIEDMEKFFEDIWNKMQCGYYEECY